MKVAVSFWGLCRSTDKIIESLHRNVFDILRNAGIQYDVFVHTFSINRPYTNIRSGEQSLMLDNSLYTLLNPKEALIEDQDEVDKRLNLHSYRSRGDAWFGQGSPWQTFENHIRSLYSLNRVTQLWKEGSYDYVVYLRPDVMYLNPLDPRWFQEKYLIMTDFGKCPVNDRFALGTPSMAAVFGERFTGALEFSRSHSLHSEIFLDYTLRMNGVPTIEVPFRFRRVRATGEECEMNILPP
jgi:hypothetical protein